MPSDSELFKRTKSGDTTAFRQLVRRHEQQIRATTIGLLGDIPEARDVAQEVFIRFYQSLDKFKEQARLSTYLSRIAINLSLNELKRQQKKKRRLVFFQKEDHNLQIEDPSANTESIEMKDLLQKALQMLEPEFRAVLVLRLIEGYSVKETAEILQLPQGTIASRLARAQKKMKDILSNFGYRK